MVRRVTEIPSFNGVAAGQTPTLDLPRDRRYHSIMLYYKTNANQATIESDINRIRVKVDGKVQRVYTPAELYAMLALNGVGFEPGRIPIFFSEPWRSTAASPNDEDAFAWGMQNVDTFQLEVELASGATSPALDGIVEHDNIQQPLEGIIKVKRRTVPVASTGVITVTDLPKNDSYLRLHAFEDTDGDISDFETQVDQLSVYGQISRRENDDFLRKRKLSPQNGVFHVVYDHTQRASDALPMVKQNSQGEQRRISEFRNDFTMGAANTFTLLTEVLGNPD